MAASNDGRYLVSSAHYDQNYNTSVKVVDTTTGGVVKTIALPTYERDGWAISAGIKDIAISPDDSRVYVTQAFGGATAFEVGTIAMIDTASNEVVASTQAPAWSRLLRPTSSPHTRRHHSLYATSVNEPRMDVYDARTLAGIGTVRLDADPSLAVAADRRAQPLTVQPERANAPTEGRQRACGISPRRLSL